MGGYSTMDALCYACSTVLCLSEPKRASKGLSLRFRWVGKRRPDYATACPTEKCACSDPHDDQHQCAPCCQSVGHFCSLVRSHLLVPLKTPRAVTLAFPSHPIALNFLNKDVSGFFFSTLPCSLRCLLLRCGTVSLFLSLSRVAFVSRQEFSAKVLGMMLHNYFSRQAFKRPMSWFAMMYTQNIHSLKKPRPMPAQSPQT